MSAMYEAIMSECLSLGGDADTNGAIVGGVIGAWLGERNIPVGLKDKIFKCTVKKTGATSRPKFLQTKHCLQDLIEKLIQIKNLLPDQVEVR